MYKRQELKKCGDNTKMQNIYDALKRLRNRDIEINNEKMWLSIGFVNYFKHIKHKSYFEVQVSKAVSYTHLDVYKRQVLCYMLLMLFISLLYCIIHGHR